MNYKGFDAAAEKKKGILHQQKMEALSSAIKKAKIGADFKKDIVWRARLELDGIALDKEIGIPAVRIVASGPGGNACRTCAKANNRVFLIEDELTRPHLPIQGCTCEMYDKIGFCTCYYEIVFEDELPNRPQGV